MDGMVTVTVIPQYSYVAVIKGLLMIMAFYPKGFLSAALFALVLVQDVVF